MLENKFIATRKNTLFLCQTLETEDYVVQPMPEVSPPKWHLAHTTWFLEELLLNKYVKHYEFYNDQFRLFFNSYYKSLGEHWIQGERGRLSRPSVNEITDYRKTIEEKILALCHHHRDNHEFIKILELAINHEEQHQELLLMDIKNIFGTNPLGHSYQKNHHDVVSKQNERWISFPEGLYEIGAPTNDYFHFDNEAPRHKVYLNAFSVSDHLVTNGEYLNFINDKGYLQPRLWLSKGWDWIKQNDIHAPLYWSKPNQEWHEYTLYGMNKINLDAPVSHISYFEADAFAKWMEMRLPTEEEFELCETKLFGEKKWDNSLHPKNAKTFDSQLWCWTKSHYSPYPGYRPFKGEAEEYNGKFMCNQFVMRGGCIATPRHHYRSTYRNFYEPEQRWMFSGIALAKDEK